MFTNENRKDISQLLDPLLKIRNQWAHFRPVATQEIQRVSSDLLDFLEPVIANWTAGYFNTTNSSEGKETCSLLAREFEDYDSDGLPVVTEPLPGYQGGFLDPQVEQDRGWTLVLQANESNDTIWVQPTAIGGSNNFGVDNAIEYGMCLRNHAIHVSVNFDEGDPIEDFKQDGFYSMRIGLAVKDENLVDGLKLISDITKNRTFRSRQRTSGSEFRGENEDGLTHREVANYLFYSAPVNVIVDPRQEGRISWRIRTND